MGHPKHPLHHPQVRLLYQRKMSVDCQRKKREAKGRRSSLGTSCLANRRMKNTLSTGELLNEARLPPLGTIHFANKEK